MSILDEAFQEYLPKCIKFAVLMLIGLVLMIIENNFICSDLLWFASITIMIVGGIAGLYYGFTLMFGLMFISIFYHNNK